MGSGISDNNSAGGGRSPLRLLHDMIPYSLNFGEKADPVFDGTLNPLICVANELINHLFERRAAGKTKRRKIGLAGGNPSQISVDGIQILWNRRLRLPDGTWDKDPMVRVVDRHERHPTKRFYHPDVAEVQDDIVNHVLRIWRSRDEPDAWIYHI